MSDAVVDSDGYWVNLARDAYNSSSGYFDANVRNRVIDDIRQFQGEHPAGSKYHADSYRLKSKLFRPKTRTAIRKNEAIAAGAYFSTEDVVSVRPMDDGDELHEAAASVQKALLQYRLTKPKPHGIPWFLTCMGAYQDAQTVGVVASFQEWVVNEGKRLDRPDVKLLPIENFRFDPAADWRDVVESSPYFIVTWPMYVKDVKARMVRKVAQSTQIENADGELEDAEVLVDDTKGRPWKPCSDNMILSASQQTHDTIRMQREDRTDSKNSNSALTDYSIVWVHQNFVEVDGLDVMYYTLGTNTLLSDPVPTDDVYPQGRPVVVGFSIIEAHKTYPSSSPSMTRDTQAEINDVANMRMDNVKLILNKRHLVKRNKQVDLRSLTRNIPSSVTLVNDTNDVKFITTDDATASSYQEQDRLNLDFDDLSGAFSGSSVASNRKLNETVGGMNLLSSQANQVSEYQLRTFTETWVEPVLRQLIILEQAFETDEKVLALVGKSSKIDAQGFDSISEEMIMQDTILNVGVGTGATNPQTQVERFAFGMRTLAGILGADFLKTAKADEIVTELFGKLGYKDGRRFFDMGDEDAEKPDPRLVEAMQLVEQLQQQLAQKEPPEVTEAKIAKLNAEAAQKNADATLKGIQAVSKRVEALFSAMNTAQIAVQTPGVTQVADSIAASAGFDDQDGGAIYPQDIERQEIPEDMLIDENTSPNFPANPHQGLTEGIESGNHIVDTVQ